MKTKFKITMILLCIIAVTGFQSGFAASNAELENRIDKLEEQSKTGRHDMALGQISDAISFFGAVEVDYSFANDADVSDKTANDSSSDLDVGTVELGVEAALHDYVTATAILKGEGLDSDNNIFWDEAFFEIKKQGIPVYLVAGKRVQPFGVFESLFINDPITCELYEINDTGLTVGYATQEMLGIDLSFTLYKGETLITRLNDAGVGWSRDNPAGFSATNDVNSFIISGTIAPLEGVDLSVFFNSEPGDTDRNTTLGTAIHFEMANFIVDAEYIGALSREKHVTDNKEYKETAWVISLGYQVIDPLLLAVRYESFDAGHIASENLDKRYGVAVTYTLIEKGSFVCSLMGEYRKTEYETTLASTNDHDGDEFFARIAIEF